MAAASAVINRARDALLDLSSTGYRWTDAELLRWLSDAQREVVTAFPEANTQTTAITPDAADVRIDMRLRAGSGVTPIAILRFASQQDPRTGVEGQELKLVEKMVLDALDPGWIGYVPTTLAVSVTAGSFVVGAVYAIRTVGTTDFTLIGAANNTVGTVFTATGAGTGTGTATRADATPYYKAVVMDPKDPLSFWLYPRANPARRVYVTFTAVPAELVATTDTLALPDQYIPMLVDYVVYRALGKDSVYTGAPNKSAEFYQAFGQKLAVASGRRTELAPTAARAPDEH
jgi:hypothetical protein